MNNLYFFIQNSYNFIYKNVFKFYNRSRILFVTSLQKKKSYSMKVSGRCLKTKPWGSCYFTLSAFLDL